MILFHQVVQVLTLPDGDRIFIRFSGVESGQSCGISTVFIEGHDLRFTVVANGMSKEEQVLRSVKSGEQQEAYRLT